MRSRGYWLLILLFLTVVSPSARADDLERMIYGGQQRSYHLHAPEAKYLNQPVPLVVVLHGALDNAFAVEQATGFTEKSRDEKFIVVYPNGTSEIPGATRELTWNGSNCCGYADAAQIDDVGFIRALIGKLQKEYPVDSSRIYVTGFSNGAILAYRLACEASDIFAAVAPVSGALNGVCLPEKPISILAFNGTADLKVLYNGGYSPVIYGSKYDHPVSYAVNFWKKFDECPADPETQAGDGWNRELYADCRDSTAVELYTIEDGDHAWPTADEGVPATDRIWDFFKSHPKK